MSIIRDFYITSMLTISPRLGPICGALLQSLGRSSRSADPRKLTLKAPESERGQSSPSLPSLPHYTRKQASTTQSYLGSHDLTRKRLLQSLDGDVHRNFRCRFNPCLLGRRLYSSHCCHCILARPTQDRSRMDLVVRQGE